MTATPHFFNFLGECLEFFWGERNWGGQKRMNGVSTKAVRIGDYLVEPDLNRVSGRGADMLLESKTMAVLMHLAARQGQVVSARDLIEDIWLGRPMGDNPVYRCISQLRHVFGDDPLKPKFIATVPTKGYCLVAPVVPVEGPRSARGWMGFLKAGLIASLAAIAILFWAAYRHESVQSPPVSPAVSASFEAYQHYMIGHELMLRRPAGFRQDALKQFDLALEFDPEFAEAYAERGTVKLFEQPTGAPALANFASAQRDIQTALNLKPDSALALAAQGFLLQRKDPPDFAASEERLRSAVALDPSMVNAWNWLSQALQMQGLEDESYQAQRRAALIDPLAPSIGANLAGREARRGLFDAAEQRLARLLTVPQPAFVIYDSLFNLYCKMGRLADAFEVARDWALYSVHQGRPIEGLGEIASVYAIMGEWERVDYWRAREELASEDAHQVKFDRIRDELATAYPGYTRSLNAQREALEAAGLALPSLALARQIEYGAMLALAGDYAAAVAVLEPLLDPGLVSQHSETNQEINARHALVWAWLQTGETGRPKIQLGSLDKVFRQRREAGQLHLSSDLFEYARNELLLGNTAHALDLLEQAEQAGWLGYQVAERDPRWDSVREEPRFVAVMQRVRVAIAFQKAKTETGHPDGDFIARLDDMTGSALAGSEN
jgi:DNA-binding winged helix-turn-helix (wHTH) protein